MRAEPAELIEDLRRIAEISHMDAVSIKIEMLVEWEAADFIAATIPVLEEIAALGGLVGEKARALLAGEFVVVPAT